MPEVAATMRTMAMEMERAGLIEEMTSDMMEDMDEGSLSEEAEDEVSKVINEILVGKFADTGAVPSARPVRHWHSSCVKYPHCECTVALVILTACGFGLGWVGRTLLATGCCGTSGGTSCGGWREGGRRRRTCRDAQPFGCLGGGVVWGALHNETTPRC